MLDVSSDHVIMPNCILSSVSPDPCQLVLTTYEVAATNNTCDCSNPKPCVYPTTTEDGSKTYPGGGAAGLRGLAWGAWDPVTGVPRIDCTDTVTHAYYTRQCPSPEIQRWSGRPEWGNAFRSQGQRNRQGDRISDKQILRLFHVCSQGSWAQRARLPSCSGA